jgi:hypothetical protein
MKKLSFLCAFLMVISFLSCKKKESTPESTASTTGSTSTVPANYYGVLFATQFDMVMSGTLTPGGGSSTAFFSASPIINSSTISEGVISALNGGTVSLNSTVLKINTSGSIYYSDTTYTLFNSPYSWSVSGATGVPAISHSFSASRPTFTGYASLKDTIKISQTNVINLTGITGADEIVVTLSGGGYVMRNLPGNTTSLTLTSADLSGLTPTTGGSMFVSCFKNEYKSFGGKDYKFKTGYQLYKQIVVQ